MSQSNTKNKIYAPITGTVMPRFAGIATFMRLPFLEFDHPNIDEVDIGLFGIPWDGGTTNRAGARFR
jgi:guanidinopropionase